MYTGPSPAQPAKPLKRKPLGAKQIKWGGIMTTNSRKNNSAFIISIYMIIVDIILFVFLLIYNPSYMMKFISLGEQQPLGWANIILIILFSIIIILLGARIKANMDKYLIKIFLFIIMIILLFINTLLILLGPSIIILYTSPVGKMFYK